MSGNSLRSISFGCLALTGLVFLTLPLSSYGKGNHQENRDIDLVSFEDPPYVFTKGSKEPGLVVRYVEALMKRSGLSYTLAIMPVKRALLYTLAQPGTCVFPIERSQEREVQLSWISPILISRHGFYSQPGRKQVKAVRVLGDVKGLKIGSYLGSGIGEYLDSLDFEVDYAANNNANIHKLKAGRIDLWASDELSAAFIAEEEGKVLGAPDMVFFTTLRAIGCHNSIPSETINNLNDSLRQMYQDKSFDRIRQEFERNFVSKPRG